MDKSCFRSSSWYQAVTLTERVNSLKLSSQISEEIDIHFAEQQMQNWRSQTPFATDSYFAERLAIDGFTEKEFLYLLGESTGSVQGRFPTSPDWLQAVEQAFSNFCVARDEEVLSSEFQPVKSWGFLCVIEPLIHQGREQLHQRVQTLAQMQTHLPFDLATIEEILFTNLPERLFQIIGRTLVLELNVARLQGKLKGDTSEERFRSFLECLRQPEVALNLLQEYPTLARQATICIQQWVTFSLEFLQHLCVDWELIRYTFSPDDDPGLLVKVEGGAGDSHAGGRAVQVAEFSSGFRLVYKPRSMAVDLHFQQLLAWLNDRGDCSSFRLLKVLDRSTHGWSEFIHAFSCNSVAEVQHFYQRQGGYLALLYALEATDFHHENLIAAGEHPVLVDLETLFLPEWYKTSTAQIEQPFEPNLFYSVMQTGLLPQRLWSNGKTEGIDISGLAAQEGQIYPHLALAWESIGADDMKLTRQQVVMSGAQNRSTLNGKEVDVLDYIEEITAGFSKIYMLLAQNVDELLSDKGLLAHFAEDEVRVVLRPTRSYMLLLRESLHPDVLRNALDRDRLFDWLWGDAQINPHLKRAIAAEREDLWQGDIPIFKTRPNSYHLWSSTKEQIANFFDVSGIDRVKRRLRQLTQENLARQLWFIRASFTTLVMNQNHLVMNQNQRQWSNYSLSEPQRPADCERLLRAARMIGDRLEVLALHGKQAVTWLGLTLVNERHWQPMPLGIDLYDGLAGIALFLGYLGKLSQENRYTTLAQLTLNGIRSYLKIDKSFITSIGGFWGWGGNIYTLTHLGTLWNQPELIDEAESYVNLLPALIAADEQLDILSGAAGCLVSLLNLYRCRSSQRTLAVAIQCGERLLDRVQPMAKGKGWKGTGSKPLTGFSHGAAGISWALLELAALTGEESFRQVALEAIAYERSLFSPVVGNWPDLREFETAIRTSSNEQVNYMTAWCHGAPGIGLARLRSLPYLDDAEICAEIEAALNTTLKQGFGDNHSLCHGDLGNLELLLQASQTLDDPKWVFQVNRLAAVILASIEQHGWLCGVPMGVETPGLMTGLAGIGYGLLRLADPACIPSALVLADCGAELTE